MNKPETSSPSMVVGLDRKVSMRLTRNELELIYIEMNSAIHNGAEDMGFVTIRDKALRLLNGQRDNVE